MALVIRINSIRGSCQVPSFFLIALGSEGAWGIILRPGVGSVPDKGIARVLNLLALEALGVVSVASESRAKAWIVAVDVTAPCSKALQDSDECEVRVTGLLQMAQNFTGLNTSVKLEDSVVFALLGPHGVVVHFFSTCLRAG